MAVYDTRVEITSPGGLPRGLSAEEAQAGRSKIRNHALAAAFNYMRYVEGWGSGFKRVSEYLAEAGIAPVAVEVSGVDVRFNVYRRGYGARVEQNRILPPTEKLPMEIEKVHIEGEKVPVQPQEVHIGDGKVHIDAALEAQNASSVTKSHALTLLDKFSTSSVFGRTQVCGLCQLQPRGATKLISLLLECNLIVPVTGYGKGKYRFKT